MATSPVTSSQGQELATLTLPRQTPDAAWASESIVCPWPPIRWVVYMTLFVLFGAYLGLNSYIQTQRAMHPVAGWKPFLWEMSSVVIVGLLVPLIIRLEDRFRIDSHARTRVILAHIAGVFVFSATHVVGIVLLRTVPDVIYLDIQLGTRSGFDVLDGVRDVGSPLIVFTTAYSDYAVRAFEIEAVDYLLKPFDRERFMRSVERTRTALAEPDRSDLEERVRRLLAGIPGRPAPARQILVRETERAFFLDVDDIQRLSAAGNYVEVHAGGKVHLVRDSLTSFAAQLDPGEFLRVHRSHVVRVSFIAELRPMFHGDYELVLRDGQTLALSRRYKALLPPAIRDRL